MPGQASGHRKFQRRNACRAQPSSVFFFLLAFAGFFFTVVDALLDALLGAMLVGLPARGAAASPGSGPRRKNAAHCGESCAFLWIMQAVMASTFGTNSPHSRIASGVQACCCSGV